MSVAQPLPAVRAEVDLAAFDRNLARVRAQVAPAQLMFVVKSDAYTHGAATLVPRAIRAGVRWVGCLELEPAVALRSLVAAETRLFAWLLAADDDLASARAADVDLGVGGFDVLEAVAATPGATPARVHLKADTGLNRNGVRREEWPAFVARAAQLERRGQIRVVGILSHISEASDTDDDDARVLFDHAVAQARSAGLRPRLRHLAASAAAFARPEFRYDMVRVGAFCYGIAPAGGPHEPELGLTPVLTLVAPVVDVRERGTIAVVPVGSLNGLPSAAAGAVTVAIDGQPMPVREVRRQALIVECAAREPRIGTSATVFGAGPGAMTATAWAEQIDTIGEEIVLRLDRRIPRVYVG